MGEYIRKYEELSPFVPWIRNDNKEKVEYFLRGLRGDISRDVIITQVQSSVR